MTPKGVEHRYPRRLTCPSQVGPNLSMTPKGVEHGVGYDDTYMCDTELIYDAERR